MHRFSLCLALLACLMLTSCATLFTGTSDNITFNSEPEGARIMIEGIDYGRTPATVTVKRPGLGDTQVVLQLDGYEDRVFTLQKEFNVVSLLNLAGFVGWIVDIATGAVMKYDPRHYEMELEREGTSFNMESLPRDAEGRYIVPAVEKAGKVTITDEASGMRLVFERQ